MVQKFQKRNKDKMNNEFEEFPKVGDTYVNSVANPQEIR